MKKLAIIGILILAVALTLAMVLPASAAVTQNDKVPTDRWEWVECANNGNGELVHLTGDLHVLSAVTDDGAGGFHVKWHFQPQGISGVGEITGDKYQGTGVTQWQLNAKPPFPYEETYVNNFRIIGPGKGNNLLVHQNLHITVNANGEVTAEVDNVKIECK